MYSILDVLNNNIITTGLDFSDALILKNMIEQKEKRFDFVLIDENELLSIW